ncbi:MAG: hypothetical protein QM831_10850 [Kofleriaceae bacterium]
MRWFAYLGLVGVASAMPISPRTEIAHGKRTIAIQGTLIYAARPQPGTDQVVVAHHRSSMKTTATVAPFGKTKTILDVTIIEDADSNQHLDHLEHHYLLDTSGTTDQVICHYAGNAISSGEYASTSSKITVTVLGKDPLSFDVKTTTVQKSTQPQPAKSSTTSDTQHFVIGDESCQRGIAIESEIE